MERESKFIFQLLLDIGYELGIYLLQGEVNSELSGGERPTSNHMERGPGVVEQTEIVGTRL